jgi:hypothetical protein
MKKKTPYPVLTILLSTETIFIFSTFVIFFRAQRSFILIFFPRKDKQKYSQFSFESH